MTEQVQPMQADRHGARVLYAHERYLEAAYGLSDRMEVRTNEKRRAR